MQSNMENVIEVLYESLEKNGLMSQIGSLLQSSCSETATRGVP